VKLEQLDTGLELRNSHMKHKYLKVVEFPEAVFTFAPVKCSATGGTFSVPGTLTLHGNSRPLQAEATLKEDGSWVDLSLKAVVKMSDFALESPQFMGVKVRDEVAISLEYRGSL
jgi:polyisoprenoid-binding protein YceI